MPDPLQPLYAKLLILNNTIKDKFPNVPELYEILQSMGILLGRKVTMAPTQTPDQAADQFANPTLFALDVNGVKLACTEVNIVDGQNNAWTAVGCKIHTDVSLDPSQGKNVTSIMGHFGASISASTTVRPYFLTGTSAQNAAAANSGWAKRFTIVLTATIPQGQSLQISLVANGVTSRILNLPSGTVAGVYQDVVTYSRINQGDVWNLNFNVLQSGVAVAIAGWGFLFAGDNNESYSGSDRNSGSLGASTTEFQSLLRTTTSGTESQNIVPWPFDSVFQNMFLRTTGTQPATGNYVVTLRNGAFPAPLSDTTLVGTVPLSGGAGEYADVTHQVTVLAGSLVGLKVVNNATSASTVLSSVHFDVDAGGTTKKQIAYGSCLQVFTVASGATTYLAVGGGGAAATSGPANHAVETDGTLKTFYVYMQTSQPITGSLTLEIVKNDVATGIILTIAAGAAAAVSSVAANLAMLAKDTFCIKATNNAAIASGVLCSWSIGFLPS